MNLKAGFDTSQNLSRLSHAPHGVRTYKFVESSEVVATSTEAREATAADAERSASRAMLVNDDAAACV